MEMHVLSQSDQQANSFKRYIQSIIEKFKPLQLFCFAKTKTSNETSGCFLELQNNHNCDYCLLMVTETNNRIDHEVQEFSNIHYQYGKISMICHSRESIDEAIKANNRFYISVYNSGQLLYSRNGMCQFDSTRKYIPTQSANKALKQYKHRMPLAEGFLRGAVECLSKQDYNISTFMLHQVVEQCCILIIRVHLDYRSEVHNLLRMLQLCTSFSEKPIKTFLSGSAEDERLFNLLLRSYSDSRYGSGFTLPEQDVQNLYARVSAYVKLVKEMCTSKIEEFERDALLYKELKAANEMQIANPLIV